MVVYDITSQESFNNVTRWLDDIAEVCICTYTVNLKLISDCIKIKLKLQSLLPHESRLST